jgi:hypothetical protein
MDLRRIHETRRRQARWHRLINFTVPGRAKTRPGIFLEIMHFTNWSSFYPQMTRISVETKKNLRASAKSADTLVKDIIRIF